MPGQFWEALLNAPAPVASGTAVASTAALTDASSSPPFVLPANTLYPGAVLRLNASGVFSNTGTPTLLLGFYWGGVAAATPLAVTGAITTIVSAVSWSWNMELWLVCRSVGTTGTLFPHRGRVQMPASLTQFQADYAFPATAPAAVSVDTTAAKPITVGAQWSASSASNTLTCHHLTVESL